MNAESIDALMKWSDRVVNTLALSANGKVNKIPWEKLLEEHTALQDELMKEKNAAQEAPSAASTPKLQ